ncbi:hypothetical protein D1823_01825 [Ruegeria sp. AD91A]|uniref:Hint domain-containing protein n=1 Tax=Ruegeria sp. AD91A TaxID=2293862 RepID=UPI000E4846B3|nr:Hint domain-containing protein [Ruegeria sp. AD91A]AXT25442.1 hypothetical protein D1823_01825 [Ruegeria sp. AD91A]
MSLTIQGPSSIAIPSGSSSVMQQYTATKAGASWNVIVSGTGGLAPSDYSVSISPNGVLTVDLTSGVVIPPNTQLTVEVFASTGPGNGNNDSLIVTVALPAGTVPCFVKGTLIETEKGYRAVEELSVGDKVRASSGEILPVKWIGKRTLKAEDLKRNPQLRPVCIEKGAIGKNLPSRDLYVSPQHRIVLEGWRAELLFGEAKIFTAAVHLINDKTIHRVRSNECVTYYHIACSRHAILMSNGLPTESLFLGDMALKSFRREDVEELLALFPELRDGTAESQQTRLSCLKRREAIALRSSYPDKNPNS